MREPRFSPDSVLFDGASLFGSAVKNPPANAGDTVQSLGQEDPLKKGMATRSGTLVWQILWPRLQCIGSQKSWP